MKIGHTIGDGRDHVSDFTVELLVAGGLACLGLHGFDHTRMEKMMRLCCELGMLRFGDFALHGLARYNRLKE